MDALVQHGMYQICLSENVDSSSIGTGLSLRIQSILTALKINGLWMGPRRTNGKRNGNIVARVPRRHGNSLLALHTVRNSEIPWDTTIGETWDTAMENQNEWNGFAGLSLVPPDMDCHLRDHNPFWTKASIGASVFSSQRHRCICATWCGFVSDMFPCLPSLLCPANHWWRGLCLRRRRIVGHGCDRIVYRVAGCHSWFMGR